MKKAIDTIHAELLSLRQAIIDHPVYEDLRDLEDLQIFMEHHVFAVWDFMSLLKSLQNGLTCTQVPWLPVGDAETRSLINEIVAGEESDVNATGNKESHFEMYLAAMQQAGCNMKPIQGFIELLRKGLPVAEALKHASIPVASSDFMRFTFDVIAEGPMHTQAAVFTFGREDLIPGMFLSIINDLNMRFPDHVSTFKYYLERHIEVDGDQHSHLAIRMTSVLCGEDDAKWMEAQQAAVRALQKRLELWNAIHRAIIARKLQLS
ncbi:Protein of unknown function (DUF3050) [Dyadobacter jejuensis]|uniref:DUF3050 family protein n=1 Tax=Dyadobacter jejuensis TaxID=1082580 RepID=A0A316B4C0_9BACT|nr:DUF3050 domain-containing protein [Dyadobacter jejuensis]PWJ57437.1 Protein of unknown function (DUF3050) [Dyadobacter jejuensis]